jgi:hypothetical protein
VAVHRADAGPTADPATAAGYGAGWLARQINAQGFVAGASGAADLSGTVDAALGLVPGNGGGAAFTRAVNYLHGQIDAYVKDSASVDRPGALAKLVMLAVVAGEDPTKFGGTAATNDLIARLLATKQTTGTDAGLFGAQSPSFDGATRQSLAILALKSAAVPPPGDAVSWLQNQQCPDKGWQAYRSNTANPCDATDLNTFSGEDSNSTAIAAQAFRSLNLSPSKGNPLDFLKTLQSADGGFGYLAGTSTDANSTALAIQAIVAGLEDPTTGRWAVAGGTPLTALLALQLGCESAEASRGAFDFQTESPLKANLLATTQAVAGAARKPYPFAAGVPAAAEPVVQCGPAPTTTTTVAPTTTTTTTVASTAVQAAAANVPTSPVATAIVQPPRFTG